MLVTHAEAALQHAEAAEKAKDNSHIKEGITHLNAAIDHGNELNIWTETRLECDLAVREKESAARESKERLARAARVVIANSENVTRLLAGLEEMQTEVTSRRVALRYILFSGLNGELAEADRARIEDLFKTDRLPAGFNSAYNSGWEQHPVHKKWDAALDALMTDAEAAPSERQKHAYDKLRAGGLSDMGAKGLISRWINVEATGGPGSVNPLSGAVGIAQWLGPRKVGITSSTSFDDQLAYVLKEIREDALGGAAGAGKLLKEAKTPEEAARAATAYERAENYNRATHIDNWTAKTLKGIERVGKAIGEAGKPPASSEAVIPGQGDPHKPGFDPSSVKFHDYFPEKHSRLSPLGHRQFANNEHHDNRVVHSNIEVKVAGQPPIKRTAHPLERTKNAALIRNTTTTAS